MFFQVTGRGIQQIKDTQRALMALWRGLPELRGQAT